MDFKNLSDDLFYVEKASPRGDFVEVCYNGCCCGKAKKGNPPVRKEVYDRRYAALRLAGKIDLRFLACLGFCRDSNTAHAHLAGKDYYFRRMNEEEDVDDVLQFAATGQMSDRLARKQIDIAGY